VKITHSRATAARYRIGEDRFGKYPAVPDDLGPIHALLFDPPGASPRGWQPRRWLDEEKFHEEVFLGLGEEAACGRYVRLVFPVRFDTNENDACPKCLEMADLWVSDRAAYDRQVRERELRRREERDRRWEQEEAESDYAEFRLRQAKALGDDPK
jgi:hypothetical protein